MHLPKEQPETKAKSLIYKFDTNSITNINSIYQSYQTYLNDSKQSKDSETD